MDNLVLYLLPLSLQHDGPFHDLNLHHGPALGDDPFLIKQFIFMVFHHILPGSGRRLPLRRKARFIEIIDEGEKHGRTIHPDYRPLNSYRHRYDLELRAVYLY